MENEEEIKFQISLLLKKEIQRQLAQPRVVKDYFGRPKPVGGGYTLTPSRIDNTGFLSNSVQVYFETDEQAGDANLVIDFGQADYWYYVDKGRKPGSMYYKSKTRKDGSTYQVKSYTKYPPLSSISQWVRQKPALTGIRDQETRTFLAARSIAMHGMFANNFIEKAIENVGGQVSELLGDWAVAFLANILERNKYLVSQNIFTNRP